MSDIVIECQSLGKSYSIGHQGPRERYTTLRDVLARQTRGVWTATKRALRGQVDVAGDQIEEFWALKDVSFEVMRGEVIGIIGRNGAGKSTLLKILSRITEPTEGRAILRGRVASLLEVGTGFHAELSGRENIFLNGAILGMTRAEIKRKFDEIVAFAEVEKFLDTPVKRYSSGMYVRLAFAVAAHLEPEILVVDEVLAVGDAEFQKKCLGKMQDVAKGGRTVLFVSHNMAAIQTLCSTTLLLKNGKIVCFEETALALEKYLSTIHAAASSSPEFWNVSDRRGSGEIRFERLTIVDDDGTPTNPVISGRPVRFIIKIGGTRGKSLVRYRLGLSISDLLGSPLFLCSSESAGVAPMLSCDGKVELRIPRLPLSRGSYQITLFLEVNGVIEDWIEHAAVLNVEDGQFFHHAKTTAPGWEGKGVLVEHTWTTTDEPALTKTG
jgi:lipopolysaccharide transport system ATP-binding protein